MTLLLRLSFAASLLLGVAILPEPSNAQSAADLKVRMSQVEDQMRQLIGQVEELTFQVRELKNQIKSQKVGAAEPPPEPPVKKRKNVAAAVAEPGIEQIGGESVESGGLETIVAGDGGVPIVKARQPRILGTLPGTTFEEDAGPTFQGQVLVSPGTGEQSGGSQQVETVALAPATGDDAETLYERSYESLLRRRFGDAETGFRNFLSNHREHGLAGNAQYWLGETYYVQGDYKTAAQAFLHGVQDYPKSRKAADSLLKLGLSLNRLGQKQQACAAYAAVGDKFPKAVETKKRANSEAKRAGC